MNELQVFNNPEFGEIRTLEENGEILFCGVDVAKMLGYVKPHNALAQHCKDSLKRGVLTNKGIQEATFIKEPDLYRLAFRSTLPGAERFVDWVVGEVLPAIRRTGSYSVQAMTPAQLIAAQAQVLVDMEQRMDAMQKETRMLSDKVDTAIKVFSRPSEDHWKADMDTAIRELCDAHTLSVTATKGRMYHDLEHAAGCSVTARLSRLRSRKKKTGARHKDIMQLNKLDAIAADKQLRAIFEGVVREWQARYADSGMSLFDRPELEA